MRKPVPPGPYLEVRGPTGSGRNGHEVIVRTMDGRLHKRSFRDGFEAEQTAKQWRDELAEAEYFNACRPKFNIREFDGTKRWFLELLAKVTEAAANGPTPDTLSLVRTIAQAARAAGPLCDDEAVRQELDEVRSLVNEILMARRHGIGTTRGTEAASAPLEPEPTLC